MQATWKCLESLKQFIRCPFGGCISSEDFWEEETLQQLSCLQVVSSSRDAADRSPHQYWSGLLHDEAAVEPTMCL